MLIREFFRYLYRNPRTLGPSNPFFAEVDYVLGT